MGLGSGIQDPGSGKNLSAAIWDLRSRNLGQKGIRSRIRIFNTGFVTTYILGRQPLAKALRIVVVF
jgi:hypothetical protein